LKKSKSAIRGGAKAYHVKLILNTIDYAEKIIAAVKNLTFTWTFPFPLRLERSGR
jgi:hypothetical protein